MHRLVLLIVAVLWSRVEAEQRCQACFAHCPIIDTDTRICDCEGDNSTCLASTCFAKLEIFPQEKTIIVQKGCASEVPGGVQGCQYAGQAESIHCYCTGDHCNSRQRLNNFTVNRLPTVECCECSETGDKQPCPESNCLRKCQGNYCLIDFDGVEQGCGLGLPRLHSFLRSTNYTSSKTTCARYQATSDTVVHGCTCTRPTGLCNELNKSREYQLKEVIHRRPDDQHFCYSLHHKSKTFIGREAFAKSELVVESGNLEKGMHDGGAFVGLSRMKYELLAGCLKVDDDRKATLGCTSEWTTERGQEEPLSRHCICASHLCNFHDLLINQTMNTWPNMGNGGDTPVVMLSSFCLLLLLLIC